MPHDQEGYRRRLLELINRISKYITRNKRSLKKGLGDIMGGRVLELETAQEHYQRWLKEQKNK